jgi:RNA polymerase sigma-70 factor, ECF subfamily
VPGVRRAHAGQCSGYGDSSPVARVVLVRALSGARPWHGLPTEPTVDWRTTRPMPSPWVMTASSNASPASVAFTRRPTEAEDEAGLVCALRAGDEAVFAALVERYHVGMIGLAALYVKDRAVAEEVAQEAWLVVLRGLHRFEARSTFKTWLFGIVVNCARTHARRERRSVPFSAVWSLADDPFEPAVKPDRFRGAKSASPGGWVSFPVAWGAAEERLLSKETRGVIRAAIDALPPAQREVVTLRDVHGYTSQEVCSLLHVSEANQRVILHRGRSRLRHALEAYLATE